MLKDSALALANFPIIKIICKIVGKLVFFSVDNKSGNRKWWAVTGVYVTNLF